MNDQNVDCSSARDAGCLVSKILQPTPVGWRLLTSRDRGSGEPAKHGAILCNRLGAY